MNDPTPFSSWQAVLEAPCSAFFRGHTSDTVYDRTVSGTLLPSCECLFTQSNARILLGHAANGSLRMAAMPTSPTYPAPTGSSEFGLGPGMYHHFDVAMYVGDLSYAIVLQSEDIAVDLAADDGDNETWYADDFLPLTRSRIAGLEVALISLAPVALDAAVAPLTPAPLPGPAGALYILHLKNAGHSRVAGTVILRASDMLIGHYEDAHSQRERPAVHVRQETLILSRPDGAVGVHLHDGKWRKLAAPFEAERAFALEPGEETVIVADVVLGRRYTDIMPTIYALHLSPALAWLNRTAAFWHERLGQLETDSSYSTEDARMSRDVFVRSLLDNFNCLQTDAQGNVLSHWQGAPSHGYGTVWGIDVEPTAVSIVHICPELARQVLLYFAQRSRAPRGAADHSVPILVAPLIIAGEWLKATGDVDFLRRAPELMAALESILSLLLSLRAPHEPLFSSRYSSDGAVGRRYDYGTNIKVWYSIESFAHLLQHLDCAQEAQELHSVARSLQEAIHRTMVVNGPFGPQISGGTNLGEEPGSFYLPEASLYYDGEDTSSMLAPIYGICDFDYEPWINYHRFARSRWCPNFDSEFGILRWGASEFNPLDGTAVFSRLGGCITTAEMSEAQAVMRKIGIDDVTGSVFWWPRGADMKRGLTRCSQGQGAWVWQYQQQWTGLRLDATAHILTVAPRGFLSDYRWQGFFDGGNRFDLAWHEDETASTLYVKNRNDAPWTIQAGFRRAGAGATGGLAWQSRPLDPGEEIVLRQDAVPFVQPVQLANMNDAAIVQAETKACGDAEGVIFARFGPAKLWGHWDADRWFDTAAMPMTIRLAVENGTAAAWSDLSVELSGPEGWQVEARTPQQWMQPQQLSKASDCLALPSLPAWSRVVAPFWVKGPYALELAPGWEVGRRRDSFHTSSQPGQALTVSSAQVQEAQTVLFEAVLRARQENGDEVVRQVQIPIHLLPG